MVFYLVYLPPLLGRFFRKALVDHRHDFVQELAVAKFRNGILDVEVIRTS